MTEYITFGLPDLVCIKLKNGHVFKLQNRKNTYVAKCGFCKVYRYRYRYRHVWPKMAEIQQLPWASLRFF